MYTIQDALRKRQAPALPLTDAASEGSPEWGGVQFGGPGDEPVLTAGQMQQDMQARQLIEDRNKQAMAEIDQAEEDRGDPMDRALAAEKKDRAFEDIQPVGETSRIQATFGQGWDKGLEGTEVGSDVVGEREMGGLPSAREGRLFDEAITRQRVVNAGRVNPAQIAEGAAVSERVQLVRELFKLRRDLDNAVTAGTMTPVQADAEYSKYEKEYGDLTDKLKEGIRQPSLAEQLIASTAQAAALKRQQEGR